MNILDRIFCFVVVGLIICYTIGWIKDGSQEGERIAKRALDMLVQSGRWVLGHAFHLLSIAFRKLAEIVRR